MTPERWQKVNQIFHAARELPPAGRDSFVRSECADDEMYALVEAMLQQHELTCTLDQGPLRAAAAVFSPGQLVSGRYRIVRFLNRGGMGEVYEAEDLEMRERVALKTLLPAIAADNAMIARFKQEIQLSRKVSHRNVCRVFDLARHPADSSSDDAVFFLTMEFLSGETLAAKLDRAGRLSPEEALPLLEQMAAALDAAHAAGIIHRDFKPSNVMLEPSPEGTRALVTDFGLARRFVPSGDTTITRTGVLMGTLDYMAPELLTGGAASVASDVYAFGTVAYRMITGRLPFPSDTPLAGAILRSKGPPPSPKTYAAGLDPKWERAMLRALDPDPGRRFASAGDFAASLHGDSPSVKLPLPQMTPRRWTITGIASLALLLSLIGWKSWSGVRGQPSPEAMKWYQTGTAALRDATYYRAAKALERAVLIDRRFLLAHARLAEALNELDDSERAKSEMLVALSGGPVTGADALFIDAVHRTLTRDFNGAIRAYTDLQAKLPRSERSAILVDLGRVREANDEPQKALDAYAEAAANDPQNAAAHLRSGILLGRQGKQAEANGKFDLADSIYQAASNSEGQAEVLYQRALVASSVRKFPEAKAALDRSIQLARAISTDSQEIAATLQLSVIAYQTGDAALAEQLAGTATDKARRAGMANLAARGLTDLGTSQFLKADYSRAEANYREALELSRRYRLRRYEARALLSLANLHQQQSNAQTVLTEVAPALDYYQKAGFPRETLQCLTLLARANRDLGKDSEAFHAFEELLTVATGRNDRAVMAQAEQGIASVLFRQERLPEALTHYRGYYEIAALIPNRDGMCRALLGSAYVLWRLGRYTDAEKALHEAEEIAGSLSNSSQLMSLLYDRRAGLALSRGLYAEAAKQARLAYEMPSATPPIRANSRCVAGIALAHMPSIKTGKRLCEEGLASFEESHDSLGAATARLALAQIHLADRDASAAAAQATSALSEFERFGYKESAWRALAILSLARRRLGDFEGAKEAANRAANRLTELRAAWGEANINTFESRPDVRYLQAELSKKS